MTTKAAPGRSAATWRNRITGSGEEAPDLLLANPGNWRLHPRNQQAALAGDPARADHYEWHEVGPDHQFHCAAYARLARLARRPIAPPLVGLISLQRGAKRDGGRVRELPRRPWPG